MNANYLVKIAANKYPLTFTDSINQTRTAITTTVACLYISV